MTQRHSSTGWARWSQDYTCSPPRTDHCSWTSSVPVTSRTDRQHTAHCTSHWLGHCCCRTDPLDTLSTPTSRAWRTDPQDIAPQCCSSTQPDSSSQHCTRPCTSMCSRQVSTRTIPRHRDRCMQVSTAVSSSRTHPRGKSCRPKRQTDCTDQRCTATQYLMTSLPGSSTPGYTRRHSWSWSDQC